MANKSNKIRNRTRIAIMDGLVSNGMPIAQATFEADEKERAMDIPNCKKVLAAAGRMNWSDLPKRDKHTLKFHGMKSIDQIKRAIDRKKFYPEDIARKLGLI